VKLSEKGLAEFFMNFNIYFLQKKTLICFLFAALVIVSLDFLLLNKNIPITEGWWETYSYAISQGFKPYVDFSLKFPPLYIYYINLQTKFLGFDFYKLRALSIIVNLIGVAGLYYWLTKLTSAIPAAFGTIFAVGLVMANPVYISKDYHTLVMIIISLVLVLLPTKKSLSDKSIKLFVSVTLSGLFCGLLLLSKQNLGVFFTFGVFLYWLSFYFVYFKNTFSAKFFISISSFILGFLIPILFTFYFIGFDWLNIFYSNDSKGNPFLVLTRFIFNKELLKLEIKAFLLVALVFFILREKPNFFDSFFKKINKYLFISNQLWLLVPIAIFFIFFRSHLYTLALAWPILRLLPLNDKFWKRPDFLLTFPLYMLAYCGTQTAGYNDVSMEFLTALMFSDIAKYFYLNTNSKYRDNKYYFLILLFTIFGLSVVTKLFGPSYNWWGLKTGSLRGDQFALPFSELKLLSADKKTYQMYDAIFKVKNDLKNQDEIFSYPSIPITYLLLKRNFVGTPVLWFDVAGSGDGAFTVSELNKKKPKYIFWLKPPRSVYEGHFNLRKKDPSMIEVDNWLFDSILSNKYQVIKAVEGFGSDIYETAPSSRLKLLVRVSNQANFETLNTLCLQTFSCTPSSTITNGFFFSAEINSGLHTTNFIERANTVFEMPNFVFYVLKRVD
jgi:hypothetical protein